ncbi:MAG: hypothetical protein JWN31_2216 [Frankiales bacterium]|nr:hypothetical protein [Frankiales bacterium]
MNAGHPMKLAARLQTRLGSTLRSDRGDIPGWVLITIMTAGLVTLIWGVANTELKNILQTALNSVSSP